VRLAFFGTPEFALPSLHALLDGGHEICLVVSRQDQPSGRHLHLAAPAVVEAAHNLGLPVQQPEKLGVDQFYYPFRDLDLDVAVVVAYGRLITPRVLRVPRHGFVNVHPSLLPRHRGPTPIETAILAGDSETGVTTMMLDEGLDTGPILMQRRTAISPKDRTVDLDARLANMGAELLLETLSGLAAGGLTPMVQDEAGVTMTRKLERKMGRIDWTVSAIDLDRRCRAFDPFPGLHTNFRGARLKVHSLDVGPTHAGQEPPGTVLHVSGAGIQVRCASTDSVVLTELQREGKRRLPVDAFLIGERVAAGERFS
jgi:methionyl-tRNA formyltransferase